MYEGPRHYFLLGDLTSQAVEGGRRSLCVCLGSHSQFEIGDPAPPQPPPRFSGEVTPEVVKGPTQSAQILAKN